MEACRLDWPGFDAASRHLDLLLIIEDVELCAVLSVCNPLGRLRFTGTEDKAVSLSLPVTGPESEKAGSDDSDAIGVEAVEGGSVPVVTSGVDYRCSGVKEYLRCLRDHRNIRLQNEVRSSFGIRELRLRRRERVGG